MAMSDLITKLRSASEDDAYAAPWTFGKVCRDAAAEIERLESALAAAREAAKPFLKPTEGMEDSNWKLMDVTAGQIRVLQKALASLPAPQEESE
jgi:hypothetical protein